MAALTELMATRRWCYWLNHSRPGPDKGTFEVSVVVENESGHFPTGGGEADPLKAPWYWNAKICDEENRNRGLSEMDCLNIVSSSMAAGSPANRNRRAGALHE